MASVASRIARAVLRRVVKPVPVDDGFVVALRGRVGGAALPTIGGRVQVRELASGELGTAAGERVAVASPRRHLLYLHGGYYLAGSPSTYRALAARFAQGLEGEVVLPDYRLAPEHPHPAAVEDGLAAYRALLDGGADPAATGIAGDSAGGGLALAVLLRARAEGLPVPAAVVLFSPWTDLTCSGRSIDDNDEADDMLTAAALRRASQLYAGGADRSDPSISPLFGDLAGLPPMLVTVDSSETLLDDSRRLVDRVRVAGGEAVLYQTSGLFHVWPALVPLLPEARRTVADAVDFLGLHLVPQ